LKDALNHTLIGDGKTNGREGYTKVSGAFPFRQIFLASKPQTKVSAAETPVQ
jgi:hypothetical protein